MFDKQKEMEKHLKILILEDSREDVEMVQRELKKGGIKFTSVVVNKKSEFENALREFMPDVILSDHSLPQFNSIEALKCYKEYQKEFNVLIPFILITGAVSEEFAVDCIKAGVDDYILKDRLKRLTSSIHGALDKCKIESDRARFLAEVLANESMMKEAEHIAHLSSWQADLHTGKHTWSDEAYRIYGYEPGEIQPSFDLFLSHVHPEDITALKKAIEDAIMRLNSYEYEFRLIDKKKNVKYINSKIVISRDADGQPTRLVGFNFDITEKKKAEIRLQKREQEYKSLFDQNPDAVCSFDTDGRFTNVNKGLADLTGFGVEELQGRDFRFLIDKGDAERVFNHFLLALQGKPQRYETRLITSERKTVTVDVTNMPIMVHNQIAGVHTVAKDITDKKELTSLLDQVHRLARIGGWEYDLAEQKVSWTFITRELLETPPDYEPDFEKFIRFYKEGESRKTIRQALQEAIEKGTSWDVELQIVTTAGNERWIRTVGRAELKDGKPVRLFGSVQDIHVRKEAEETLKDAYTEKITILESIGDAFFAVNKDWIVTYWNNIAENKLGVTREEIIGKNLWTVFGEAMPLEFSTEYHKAMDENIAIHFEGYYPSLGIWFAVNVYPSNTGLSVYFNDITAQKKYIKEIENQNMRLKEIAWIQSHEVRAPLARMMGLVDLINNQNEQELNLPDLLKTIGGSARELDELIRKIVRKTEAVQH